ncbi:MAG TPA: CocE/NonD family hydrolase [Gaiellaceae bacterium]|nr:CocE/NonD family hydrolase [Gaiellaceae bacterium]
MRAAGLARAQFDALAMLAATLVVPGSEFVARRVRTPSLDEQEIAGVPTTVVRPSGRRPWPAVVFANGATREGRQHPLVRRLAWGFGWAGYLTYVPDLPGVADGELTPSSLEKTVAVASHAASAADGTGTVALAGISTGATLSLLAAADPRLADRVSAVGALAPFADLEKIIMLATTRLYRNGERLDLYSPPPYLLVALTRSLTACLPPFAAQDGLCVQLRALDGDSTDPVVPLRALSTSDLGRDGTALLALLDNRDPARFLALYEALPEETRASVELLSPSRVAARILAPTEVLTAPRDTYFPLEEALAVTSAAPRGRLTLSGLFAHATPALSPRRIPDLGRLDGFIVRWMAAARG